MNNATYNLKILSTEVLEVREYTEDNAFALESEVANSLWEKFVTGLVDGGTVSLTRAEIDELRDVACWRLEVNAQELENGCDEEETQWRKFEVNLFENLIARIDRVLA